MASRPDRSELVAAFDAGYSSAMALVELECGRPALQKLALRELAVLLRRQSHCQRELWEGHSPMTPPGSVATHHETDQKC